MATVAAKASIHQIAQDLIDKAFQPPVHYKMAKQGLRVLSWLVFILPTPVVMLARVAARFSRCPA
jgi:hypothetical protein